MKKSHVVSLLFGVAVLVNLQGCANVTFVSPFSVNQSPTDRRSDEVKADDEAIEWKACSRISDKLGPTAHVSCKSFNYKVLITGEVPTEEAKTEAKMIATNVAKVKRVWLGMTVGPISEIKDRNTDRVITTTIGVRGKDTGKLNPLHVQVVTESLVVYSMGLVSDSEMKSAAYVIGTTRGIKKYMNLLETITQEEADALDKAHAGVKTP